MGDQSRTRIVIIGAGKGGTALLELFIRLPHVEIVGIADMNPGAPGLHRAEELGIPTSHDAEKLISNDSINLIVDVTDDSSVQDLINRVKRPDVEVAGGATSKLLWDLVQHEADMQSQLFHSEKLASIGTFASGLAHDINNPMYIILGLAEFQLEEDNLQKLREYARDILVAGKEINKLCRGLTEYARQSSAGDLIRVDLHETVEKALSIAKHATNPRQLSVEKEFSCPIQIMARSEELLQVFVNLLINAIHAMEGAGQLTLSSSCDNGKGFIAISDTGSGIPSDIVDKIFDPFFTTKPPGKGTGLGLHSVRAIVHKLQGELSVNSEVGKGTTFRMTFPLASSS